MEDRLVEVTQRLREEQAKVLRLESRTAALEAQVSALMQAFPGLNVPDGTPAAITPTAERLSATKQQQQQQQQQQRQQQKPNTASGWPDSPELGPTGRGMGLDGSGEDDRLSLFPNEDGEDAHGRDQALLSGHTLNGAAAKSPPIHYDPRGWLGTGAEDAPSVPSRHGPDHSRGHPRDRHSRDRRDGPRANGRQDPRSRSRGRDRDRDRDRDRRDRHSQTHSHSHSHSRDPRDAGNSHTRGSSSSTRRQRGRSKSPDQLMWIDTGRGRFTGAKGRAGADGQAGWATTAENASESGGRRTGPPRASDGYNGASGWIVHDFAAGIDMPAMPTSVTQITNAAALPSCADKVMAWKQENSVDATSANAPGPPPGQPEGMPDIRPLGTAPGVDVDAPGAGLENSASEGEIGGDGDDDDDDDDDDPLSALRSREYRLEASATLTDDSGMRLTFERLGPLWGAFGWIPLDDLPRYYERVYGAQLWTAETRGRVRSLLRDMEGLSVWGTAKGPLLFRNGAHLENSRRFAQLFVDLLVPEPMLFFFVVTTVLRPLELEQSEAVVRLWESRYRRTPLGLRTVTPANHPRGEVRWIDMAGLWRAAVEWLCELGRVVMRFGCAHLRDRIAGWTYDGFGSLPAPEPAAAAAAAAEPTDPASALVFGLRREDLGVLLDASPVLLATLFSKREILRLEDELQA
ncbi:hypothetical protein H4R18_001741 [Coemansia javaensis]|uniref:Uncharacterized protein n=1 Tax=Coemansia javaensis TaxID=2761396 RepID=A0A9W8HJR0_9FUNG|nr:hypothetical protein H4R18_001741 [Coemansia javaensis]